MCPHDKHGRDIHERRFSSYSGEPGTYPDPPPEDKQRECRSCNATIENPFPNQFECARCEELGRELGINEPDISEVSDPSPDDVSGTLPSKDTSSPRDESKPEQRADDLVTAVMNSEQPTLDMTPEHRDRILNRIDGAANEPKFRALHFGGEWEQFYEPSEYDDPKRTAVVGYLRIIAFYTLLSVPHMEAFYRSSALYDESLWCGWDRIELLELAIDEQNANDQGYRIYGSEESFEVRLEQANRRLSLIERRIER